MSNLIKLLQPKEYKSKIKLYCSFCVANFPHFVQAFSAQKKRNKVINICEIEK